MSDTNKEREAAYEHVREALVAVFEQRDGALSLVSKAIRVLPRLTEPSAQVQGETPAPLRDEAVGTLTISKFRGHLENHDFDYYGGLPEGTHHLYAAPMPQSAALEEVVSLIRATKNFTIAHRSPPACYEADMDAIIAAVLALAPGLSGWQEIASAHDEEVLLVFYRNSDGEDIFDFDYRSEGVWQKHYEHYEHVQIIGGWGVKEEAPYTHWMKLPAAPGLSK